MNAIAENPRTRHVETPDHAAPSLLSVDLVERSYRASSFPADWSREQRERALRRYERFLLLVARDVDAPATPTRDIDEMWHLHMLHPVAYQRDCARLFGGTLDHDGGFGNDPAELPVLQGAFRAFARRWREAYDEPYVEGMSDDEAATNCWHDCTGRCWHACKSVSASKNDAGASATTSP
ncbi:MAG: glycine-rich domain-containing protein-like [Myxococcota bacterium]|nr:glycine-rich domain-containing protein-like [Myxococcota bacterium]